MSLPKRDGVHDRYYLIHKPDTAPEVLAEADACIQDILDGTARENHAAYPTVVRNRHSGRDRTGEPRRLSDRGAEPKRNALSSQSAAGAVPVQAAFEGLSL